MDCVVRVVIVALPDIEKAPVEFWIFKVASVAFPTTDAVPLPELTIRVRVPPVIVPVDKIPLAVAKVEFPAKVTLPSCMALLVVLTFVLMVVVLAVEVSPPVNVIALPAKATPPVLIKLAAFVTVPPPFKATE